MKQCFRRLSQSDLPRCLGTTFLWLTISGRLTYCAHGVAFPSTSLEVTFPLARWSLRECPWLTGLQRDLSNIDVATSNWLNLVEISRRDFFKLIESWSILSFFSTESSNILLPDMVNWGGLHLLNRVFRNSTYWHGQLKWRAPTQQSL